jgi:hypothetical protein
MGDGEAGVMEKEELDEKEGNVDENENKEEFCEQELPPDVGFGDPPLAIADERLGLDDAKDKERPEKHQDRSDEPSYLEKEHRPDISSARGFWPNFELSTSVKGEQSQGDEDFGPVATDVFFEDVEDWFHGRLQRSLQVAVES